MNEFDGMLSTPRDTMSHLAGAHLGGRPIYSSLLMTISVVKRHKKTWAERLFSLPWRPMKKHKFVNTEEPDPQLMIMENGAIIGHPSVVAKIHDMRLNLH